MSGTLREDLRVFRIFGGDIRRAIINTMHCCVARVLILIILLTATYVRQQQTGNAMLHFHGNNCYMNALQYYVIVNRLSCST